MSRPPRLVCIARSGFTRLDRLCGVHMLTRAEADSAICTLESEMQHLQLRHPDLFGFANAWAQRHDAILAMTPDSLRAAAEQRLHRIGIRWGVAHGVRMTGQFPALES